MFTNYISNYDALRIPEDITQSIEFSLKDDNKQVNSYNIIGNSTLVRKVNKSISKLAELDRVSVLITGESGTGKELIARGIHKSSKRKEAPFVSINCADITHDLVRGELFGYVKGIYTGADKDTDGCFQKAGKGMFVLDEIGDLPLQSQGTLLRVLQGKAVRKIGDSEETSVECRFIFITNKNLIKLVQSGAFKEDLYYRITQGEIISSPPLRDRENDILYLAVYLIPKLSAKLQLKNALPVEISGSFIRAICDYEFPGNIRELEGIITRVLIRNQTGNLTDNDFYESLNPEKTDPKPLFKTREKNTIEDYYEKKLQNIGGILPSNKIFIAKILASLTNSFKQKDFIFQMARYIRLHDNTVRRYLSILVKHGILIHNNGKSNRVRYTIAA